MDERDGLALRIGAAEDVVVSRVGVIEPTTRRLFALVAAATGMIFLALLIAVAVEGATPKFLDKAVVEAAHRAALHHGVLRAAARAATQPGSPLVANVCAAVAVIGLWLARLRREAVAVAVSRALCQALTSLTKLAVARPRPHWAHPVAHASGYSFPSGHSAAAASVYVPLALVAWSHLRQARLRWAAAIVAGALSVAVAVSRVLLGVHYPSDVVAGLALGVAVTAISWLVVVDRALTVPCVTRRSHRSAGSTPPSPHCRPSERPSRQ